VSETWVYGCHAVEALLSRAPQRILSVHFQRPGGSRRLAALRGRVLEHGLAVEDCRPGTLERLVGAVVHQGVAARVRPARPLDEKAMYQWLEDASSPLVLVLDGIQDPRNLGACLRSADAAGAGMVVITRSESADLTPAARKSASGAVEWLPVARVGNVARAMAGMKERGLWLLGADDSAGQLYRHADLRQAVGLVLGAEGSGLRRLTRESCDALMRIPMLGGVDSLNVSVACGVLLYEALRQRQSHD